MKQQFTIGWIEHQGQEHFDSDDLRATLDKGTTFENHGDTYGDGSYEIEFSHHFEAEDIVEAIFYVKKYIKNSPHDIEVFSVSRIERVFTEELLHD